MTFQDRISIASAITALMQAGEPLVAGVVTHVAGDDAAGAVESIGEALDMTVLRIVMKDIEYHPGAINAVAYGEVEPAVTKGRPVLFVLQDEHLAARCVTEAICSAIALRTEDAPCAIVALTVATSEADTHRRLSEGLDDEVRIVMSRVTSENLRLLDEAVCGMGKA